MLPRLAESLSREQQGDQQVPPRPRRYATLPAAASAQYQHKRLAASQMHPRDTHQTFYLSSPPPASTDLKPTHPASPQGAPTLTLLTAAVSPQAPEPGSGPAQSSPNVAAAAAAAPGLPRRPRRPHHCRRRTPHPPPGPGRRCAAAAGATPRRAPCRRRLRTWS